MNEREPTVPSVLSDLIESLYTRIESKLQATHDNTGILHDSDAKLLEKVQECLNQISADSETRSSLNSRIAELQSRNETLIADKVVRDRQLDSVLKTNQELQTSLSETQQRLVAIDLELQNTRSVPTDDPQLQARLQALESLQETLREQLEAAKRETAQANTQKSRLQDATLLAKEQLEETLIKLTDTQSLMETLKAENDNYVASAKDSTEKVRQEVAKAASASKAELEIRYKGLAKTLEQRRREAEDELNSVKETLHRMERETTNSSSVIVKLQEGLRNQNIQLQAQDTAIQRLKEQNVDMNIAHGDSLNQQQALKELAELREQIRTTQTQSRQISEDALRSQKDAEYKLNVFDAQQREKHLLQAENVNLVAFKAGLEIEKSNLQKTVDELRQSLNAGDDKLRKIKALEEDKASLELANRDLQMKIVQANHSHGHDRLQFRNIKSLEHAQIINGYHQGNASPRLHTQGLAGHTHSPLNTPSRNGDPKPSPLRNTTSNFQDRIVNSHPEASIATPTSNFASSVQEMGSQSSQALVEGTRILRAAVRKSNGMGKHQLLPVQQSQTKKRAEATTVIDQASMTLSNKFGFNSCLGTAKSIQGSTSMPPGVVIPYSSSLSPSKIEEQHTSDEIDELSTTLMDEQEDIKVMHGGSFVDNAIVETKSLTKNTPVIVTSELINSKDLSEVIIQTPKPAPSTTEEAARRRASQPLKSAMKLRATSNLLSDTKLADLVLSAEDGAQISNSILQEKATEKGINKNLLRAQSKGARVGSSYNRVVAGQSTKASCASADSNGHPTKQQTQASPRLKDTKKSPAMTVPRRNQSGKRQADSPIPPNKAVKAPRMSSTHTSDSKSKMVIPDTKCPDYQSADSQGSEYFPGSSALNPRYWGR